MDLDLNIKVKTLKFLEKNCNLGEKQTLIKEFTKSNEIKETVNNLSSVKFLKILFETHD